MSCVKVAEWRNAVEIRRLARTELSRVVEIDRTERIDVLYEQRGTELVERRGNWSAPAWDPDGHGEHSVEAQRHALEHYADAGGIALGAFSGGRLVGIGVVVPHLRPAIAQLAFLHVSEEFRAAGIGSRLCDDLELIARGAGDSEMVVSATPSENTVRFYLGRGYELMAAAAAGALRARARGRAHAEGALSHRCSSTSVRAIMPMRETLPAARSARLDSNVRLRSSDQTPEPRCAQNLTTELRRLLGRDPRRIRHGRVAETRVDSQRERHPGGDEILDRRITAGLTPRWSSGRRAWRRRRVVRRRLRPGTGWARSPAILARTWPGFRVVPTSTHPSSDDSSLPMGGRT